MGTRGLKHDTGGETVSSRDVTIDVAKDLAITLVVLAHMDRGLIAAGLVSLDGWAGYVDLWLYSFFIPLFMFLSGLFVASSSAKLGARQFLFRREADLLWLYLVWSLINGFMQVGFSRFTNADVSPWDVLQLWWPLGQMLFLPSLAFATVVVVLLRPWASSTRGWIVLAVLLGVAVLTWQAFEVWPLAWLEPELVARLLPGIATGVALLGRRSLPIYVSHTIFTAGARLILRLADVDWIPIYVGFGVAAGLAGPLLLFWLANRFGSVWLYQRPRARTTEPAVSR